MAMIPMNDLNFPKRAGLANRQLDFRLPDLEFVRDDDESVLGFDLSMLPAICGEGLKYSNSDLWELIRILRNKTLSLTSRVVVICS